MPAEPAWSFSETTRRLVGTSLAIESEREFNLPNSGDPAADMRTPEQVEFRQRGCAMEVQFPGVPSDEIVAEAGGIGDARFGMEPDEALAILTGYFGGPNHDTGWLEDGCDGADERRVSWQGLTAIFSDREGPYNGDGTRRFDGWSVLAGEDRPSSIRFPWGITPELSLAELTAVGAVINSVYPAWTLQRFGLTGHTRGGIGEERDMDAPSIWIGTGSGGFIDC